MFNFERKLIDFKPCFFILKINKLCTFLGSPIIVGWAKL